MRVVSVSPTLATALPPGAVLLCSSPQMQHFTEVRGSAFGTSAGRCAVLTNQRLLALLQVRWPQGQEYGRAEPYMMYSALRMCLQGGKRSSIALHQTTNS